MPFTQCTHVVALLAVALLDEYLPASQGVQLDDPSVLMDPALHDSQLACPVAPWYRPASHKSQDDEPVAACAMPLEQAVHPVEPVKAALKPASRSKHLSWPVAGW